MTMNVQRDYNLAVGIKEEWKRFFYKAT